MSETRTIRFTLNGRAGQRRTSSTHHNLVELLHELGLFGARESCGQGLCGCCTVLVDDVAVSGCLYLAVRVDGKSVTTIEHLDANGDALARAAGLHRSGAFQCGFCTPGFRADDASTAEAESRSERRGDRALSLGQSLPLRRLSGNRRGGAARRAN